MRVVFRDGELRDAHTGMTLAPHFGATGVLKPEDLAPNPSAGPATKFLREDSTWQVPSGGTQEAHVIFVALANPVAI